MRSYRQSTRDAKRYPAPARHKFAGEIGVAESSAAAARERLTRVEPFEADLAAHVSAVNALDARLAVALADPDVRVAPAAAESAAQLATDAHARRGQRAAALEGLSHEARLLLTATASVAAPVISGAAAATEPDGTGATPARGKRGAAGSKLRPAAAAGPAASGGAADGGSSGESVTLLRALAMHVSVLRDALGGGRIRAQRESVARARAEWELSGPIFVCFFFFLSFCLFCIVNSPRFLTKQKKKKNCLSRTSSGEDSLSSQLHADSRAFEEAVGEVVGLRKRRSDGEGEDTSDMYAVELEDDAADAHEQRNKIRQEFASIETSVAAAEARVREAEAQVDDSLVYSTPGTPKRSGMGATF
jgi:hypothetical protein